MTTKSKIIIGAVAGTVVLVVTGVLLWYASHTSGDHVKYIPKNAAIVSIINVTDIAQKIDTELLKGNSPIKSDLPPAMQMLMENPFDCGIDLLQDIYLFTAPVGDDPVWCAALNLSGKSDFTAFVKKLDDQKPVEANGISTVYFDAASWLQWNDEVAIFSYAVSNNEKLDTATAQWLQQTPETSIKSVALFEKVLSEEGDILLYTNNTVLNSSAYGEGVLQPLGWGTGFTTGVVRFEEAAIVATLRDFTNDGQPALSLLSDKVSGNSQQIMSDTTPLFSGGMNLNMPALFASLRSDNKTASSLDMVNRFYGLDDQAFIAALDGSVTFALSDYRDISKTDPRLQAMQNAIFAKLAAINKLFGNAGAEMEEMEKVVVPIVFIKLGLSDVQKAKQILHTSGLIKEGDFYATPTMGMAFYAGINGKQLMISNHYQSMATFTQAGKLPYTQQINNGPQKAQFTMNMNTGTWSDGFSSVLRDKVSTSGKNVVDKTTAIFGPLSYSADSKQKEIKLPIQSGKGNSLNALIAHLQSVQL
jgi:hypothetical protein